MKNLLKKGGLKSIITILILLISQVSVWAQSTNTNEVPASMSGLKVVVFFLLLLIVLIAPAFKRSEHTRNSFSSK